VETESEVKVQSPLPAQHDGEARKKSAARVPLIIGVGVAALVALGALMMWRADAKTNKVPLSSEAKPVTVIEAKASPFHATRTYVGRLDPWVGANVGPQFVSAYVDTVLVRPGDVVKQGQVLATLDCRSANAMAQAIQMQARALDEQQKALSHEASRVGGLLEGGFVSPNEAEQKNAQSSSKQSELMAEKAKLLGTSLEVNDCVLRAPFDGDVATRTIDPGAFVRPGTAIVSVVDRSVVRMTADVPERDFDIVSTGKNARIVEYATGKEILGSITRRAPAADPGTRTVHIEIDIPDPTREIPVGTTGEVSVDVGDPIPATELPLAAATMRDAKATVFVVEGDVAHAKTFVSMGEVNGMIFAKPTDIPSGTHVVSEGRGLIKEGDRVVWKVESFADTQRDGSVAASGATP
jgi:RND family efflux transporter MFP subunit